MQNKNETGRWVHLPHLGITINPQYIMKIDHTVSPNGGLHRYRIYMVEDIVIVVDREDNPNDYRAIMLFEDAVANGSQAGM